MTAVTYPNATHYSEHFTRKELNCHCGCKPSALVEANLVVTARHLEELRVLVGAPLTVNDAHRCTTENRRVGGQKNSLHIIGKATDCDTGRLSNAEFTARAAKVPAFKGGGIGTYPSSHMVHVDWRGYVARWDEKDYA